VDDETLNDIITRASRLFDKLTRRTYYARTETRYYGVPDTRELALDDDLLTITTLTNGDGVVLTATEYYLQGNAAAGMYCETKQIGSKTEAEVPRLPYGKYKYIFIAPLRRANFDPDVFIVYGNPAQIMRLMTAYLYKRGGYLHSRFSGRLDCADMVIETFNTDECQLILPCYGDRIFGLTQDDEMAFSVPKSKVALIQEGLAGTHKGGIRYPIPTYLQFEGKFPDSYTKVEKPEG